VARPARSQQVGREECEGCDVAQVRADAVGLGGEVGKRRARIDGGREREEAWERNGGEGCRDAREKANAVFCEYRPCMQSQSPYLIVPTNLQTVMGHTGMMLEW
jgi:hypothetical protein